jgi:light-regulated signal transduction histidine kinase (bacteriophytochrome)
VASHDLQEPLRKVASFCQLLQRRYAGQLDERADQYISFAVDGAHRMQRLINDLLKFSRIGRVTSDFTDVDLGAIVAAAADANDDALARVDGTVEALDLPTVRGDEGLLVGLFANLISNSIKFHQRRLSGNRNRTRGSETDRGVSRRPNLGRYQRGRRGGDLLHCAGRAADGRATCRGGTAGSAGG